MSNSWVKCLIMCIIFIVTWFRNSFFYINQILIFQTFLRFKIFQNYKCNRFKLIYFLPFHYLQIALCCGEINHTIVTDNTDWRLTQREEQFLFGDQMPWWQIVPAIYSPTKCCRVTCSTTKSILFVGHPSTNPPINQSYRCSFEHKVISKNWLSISPFVCDLGHRLIWKVCYARLECFLDFRYLDHGISQIKFALSNLLL